jgi:hypothetical protein
MRQQPAFSIRLVLAVLLFSIPPLAFADSIAPSVYGTGTDGGTSYGGIIDGTFDSTTSTALYVRKTQTATQTNQTEKRTVYEFALPAGLSQPGVTIESATLDVPVTNQTWTSGDSLTVYGYSGNGQVSLADFAMTANPIWTIPYYGGSPSNYYIDAKSFLQSLAGNATHAGFVLTVGAWGTQLQLATNASLVFTYSVNPPSTYMPSLTILSPANGSQYTAGTSVAFHATASDPQDGSLDNAIQWTSSLTGYIGNGFSFMTALPPGVHILTATVTDSNGNTATATRTVTVLSLVNTTPQVTISSPANGAQLVAGAAVSLTGSAVDVEDGQVSQNIKWTLDGVSLLGSGANLPVTLTAGSHTITAAVTDSGGLTGQASISVYVATPAVYCDARGSNAGYEWINTISIGSQSNTSGSNGGYGNFTLNAPLTVAQGANSVVLTPGYPSGSYSEYWAVWIDLNRDNTFGTNELLVSTNGAGALSRTLTIPATTTTGTTRMRVAMKYGGSPAACGTFSWGEVEDYTVNIVPGNATPPPSTVSYCSSRGQSTGMEWIAQTSIAGVVKTSGNDQGYGDFTNGTPISLVRASNTLTLTSGYPGAAYPEQWMVWIDFNQDGTFGNEDFVFAGGGALSVGGSFVVPATALSGKTRMRVSMKYGSIANPCETFLYGEVEDYAVTIP